MDRWDKKKERGRFGGKNTDRKISVMFQHVSDAQMKESDQSLSKTLKQRCLEIETLSAEHV